jgi:hypothetical protein
MMLVPDPRLVQERPRVAQCPLPLFLLSTADILAFQAPAFEDGQGRLDVEQAHVHPRRFGGRADEILHCSV